MIVDVLDLKKHFGTTLAVDGVSFRFGSGQIFGFVGPNGAGKTTTMRILATLDEPTAGDAFVDGISVHQDPEQVRRLVGFVPDTLPETPDTTVDEYLDFYARAYGLRGAARTQAVTAIEEFTGLRNLRQKLVSTLSKGLKQRVSLGRALIHDPAVLILDEPAAGLDPRARVELRELLAVLAERQKAVLISSHILTELTEICHGVVIIECGKLVEFGTIAEVTQRRTTRQTLAIRCLAAATEVTRILLELPGVDSVRSVNGGLQVELDGGEEQAAALLAELCRRGCRVTEFRPVQANLETIFMKVTHGEVQ